MIESLKLRIYVEDSRVKEIDVIIARAMQYLNEVKKIFNHLYICRLKGYEFELIFEKDYEDFIAMRLKLKVPYKQKKYELMGDRFDLEFYVNIFLKLTEGYQIVSLNSVDSDSVEVS